MALSWHRIFIKMARIKDQRQLRRIQFRLEEGLSEICDRYSTEELNSIFSQALKTISPVKAVGTVGKVIVRPQILVTATVARLSISGKSIYIVFPEKRDDFRSVMVRYRYEWVDWKWQRTIKNKSDLIDRAAEITNEMLMAGFCVQVEYSAIKDSAINSTYIPEPIKVIDASTSNPYNGWFVLSWPRTEDWYKEAMKITCAKYGDGRVRVPPEQFAEIEDFAELNGFKLTPEAEAIANQSRAEWMAAIIVQPKRKTSKSQKKAKHSSLDEIVVEVPNALIDDDA